VVVGEEQLVEGQEFETRRVALDTEKKRDCLYKIMYMKRFKGEILKTLSRI
jgi:hypothetical protein